MRSRLGIWSSLLFLLAPGAAIASVVFGEDAPGIVIHVFLGAGSVLFAFAVFDFGVPRWINIFGAVAGLALGAIFLLQAASLLFPTAGLDDLAFQVLGGNVEGVL